MTDPEPASVRTAVIGVGYLGRFHAQKYASLPGSELVAVVDADDATVRTVAEEVGATRTTDYRDLLGKVDAVSIAVPTPLHFKIARDFLMSGAHVLVEKPITTTIEEARTLIELARRGRKILQVGHLERFNPAIVALTDVLRTPRFVESHRLAPFKQRGTDVSVVLDLMIHDIDLIQELVGAPPEHIDAVGASVFSGDIDIANARLKFAGGCVANTTASRVSLKQERKIRIFQDDAYLSVDLQQKILTIVRRKEAGPLESPAQVTIEERSFDQGDALRAEIESFLSVIRTGGTPVVTGEDGLQALQTATQIAAMVGHGPSDPPPA